MTRADPATLQITGGPINREGASAEVYATVFALAESAHEPGVIWAGSDDGLVHITKDNGETWTDISPANLPEWSLVSTLELSPHDAATCYLAALRYKHDDYAPYLYKTSDYGRVVDAHQRRHRGRRLYTRVIRCDPSRQGLLYAGTETGVYVSFNDGASWQPLQLDLPVTPIHDLLVKNKDLVAATHGRSFWILDDLTRLHQLDAEGEASAALLLQPRATQRILESIDGRRLVDQPGKTYMSSTGVSAAYTHTTTAENVVVRKFLDSGENLPRGVLVTYYLPDAPVDQITLSIADAAGKTLHEFCSMDDAERQRQKEKPDKTIVYLTAEVGWNRFVWDMRLPASPALNGKDPQFERMPGPTVPPGKYQLTLSVGGVAHTQTFDLVKDATSSATDEELQEQFELLVKIYDCYSSVTDTVNTMRRYRDQLGSLRDRLADSADMADLAQTAADLCDQVREIEKQIFVPDLREGWAGRVNQGTDSLRRLSGLPAVVGLGEFPPTVQAYAVFDKLSSAIQAQVDAFERLRDGELAAFNRALAERDIALLG